MTIYYMKIKSELFQLIIINLKSNPFKFEANKVELKGIWPILSNS